VNLHFQVLDFLLEHPLHVVRRLRPVAGVALVLLAQLSQLLQRLAHGQLLSRAHRLAQLTHGDGHGGRLVVVGLTLQVAAVVVEGQPVQILHGGVVRHLGELLQQVTA
jgi:hypothetical protein